MSKFLKRITPVLLLAAILLPAIALAQSVDNPAPKFFISLQDNSVKGIIMYAIQMLLGIVGILSLLFLVIGGFQYITSGANPELAESGKKTVRNSIIGLIIVLLSYIIVITVVNTLYTS